MTPILITAAAAQACPECFPGDFPPVTPSAVIPDGGSLCAFYVHAECGRPAWAGKPLSVPLPAVSPVGQRDLIP